MHLCSKARRLLAHVVDSDMFHPQKSSPRGVGSCVRVCALCILRQRHGGGWAKTTAAHTRTLPAVRGMFFGVRCCTCHKVRQKAMPSETGSWLHACSSSTHRCRSKRKSICGARWCHSGGPQRSKQTAVVAGGSHRGRRRKLLCSFQTPPHTHTET